MSHRGLGCTGRAACCESCVVQPAVPGLARQYNATQPLPRLPAPRAADAESIDASIGGIVKRVALLLLALSGLGVALFYLGLKYAFVDSPY